MPPPPRRAHLGLARRHADDTILLAHGHATAGPGAAVLSPDSFGAKAHEEGGRLHFEPLATA